MVGILTKAFEARVRQIYAGFEKANPSTNVNTNLVDEDDPLYKAGNPKQQAKVKKVMEEFKNGKLKSGSGDAVTDRKQAIAIAMSEAGLSKADRDTLEKGLGYELRNIDRLSKGGVTSKTGKEIKNKLESLLPLYAAQHDKIMETCGELQKAVGGAPDKVYSDYDFDDLVYPQYTVNYGQNMDDTEKLKDKHNDAVRMACGVAKDMKIMKTLVNNIKDGDRYNLKVDQLAKLNF